MKKNLFLVLTALLIFWAFMLVGNGNYSEKILPKAEAATTANVTLSGTVLSYLALTIGSGSTILFGNITPNIPQCGDQNTQADVVTNASGGYTLKPTDSSDANSAMVHSDGTTYLPDFISGTIVSPALWTTQYGVGINLFSGTQKNTTTWGTGTVKCSSLYDKWAGLATVPMYGDGYTVTGYHASTDSSYWGWQVNVANTQKTGVYSGIVLFTSTAVL